MPSSPPVPALTDQQQQALLAAVATHQHLPGALLPLLHAIQDALGWVPPGAVPLIAEALNLSRAEVHGVISFYHHFRSTPPGRVVVQLCRAESCQARGGLALEAHVKQRLGLDWQQTRADGTVSLEPVYCLGNCACSPAMRIGDAIHGRLSPARFDAILAQALAEADEVPA